MAGIVNHEAGLCHPPPNACAIILQSTSFHATFLDLSEHLKRPATFLKTNVNFGPATF